MCEQVNIKDLRDIREVRIDRNVKGFERDIEFVRQIGDPHHYKCMGYYITAKFDPNGPPLVDCVQRIMA
jgi:hypothetical protein